MSALLGRKIFITGGERRVRKGIALGLAKDGADVAIHYFPELRRSREKPFQKYQRLGSPSFSGAGVIFKEQNVGSNR